MRRSETRKPRPIWTLWGAVLIPAALVVLFELAKSRPAWLAAWASACRVVVMFPRLLATTSWLVRRIFSANS